MTLYFLSGLGADRRVFKNLKIKNDAKIQFLDWLQPQVQENLVEYAERMAKKIDTSSPFVLIGYSFGGILATEMLRFIQPQKTILISSVSRRQELPWYYRWFGKWNLHTFLPEKASNRANLLTYFMFGTKTKQDKILLKEVLATTDTVFSKWAIHQILTWDRILRPPNILRIHGERDRMLPIIDFIPDYKISGGAHFMISSQAVLISGIIDHEINSI